MSTSNLRVLIVADNASLKFGGEAALPLHYFRVLRRRGIETWLVVHERTRDELKTFFPQDFDRIHFVTDTEWHRRIWQWGKFLPSRVSSFTSGFALGMMTQIVQRRIAKQLVQDYKIDIIHQPIPVSPKQPSMIFGLGVPVAIGPMNGGMDYPPAFRQMQKQSVELFLKVGRLSANILNRLIPGKQQATTLLVANARTREALPTGMGGKVVEVVENGVDLSIWDANGKPLLATEEIPGVTQFIYVGRLVDWKAVDLLLIAFKQIVEQVPAKLEIVGDGVERVSLEEQAIALGLMSSESIRFSGWLSQADCAQRLEAADVMVLPSLLECGGAVVLEAMAMGLPVIATNWGGPADYLDASCGVLVEPTSRDAFIANLAAAMIGLAKSPQRRQEMGKAGHQRVIDCFDWEVKVDRILEIYQEAIERSRSVKGEKLATIGDRLGDD